MAATAHDTTSSWSINAHSWDTTMGSSGNDYFNLLQIPTLTRMIGAPAGDKCFDSPIRILDLATGNGLVAHWLARKGANVVATDGSGEMVKLAKKRGVGVENVEYQVLDVTDQQRWDEFIKTEAKRGGVFNVVTMNMAIMDVSRLDVLAEALPKILKKDGIFVATLLHPLFTAGVVRCVDYTDDPQTGREEETRHIKLSKYLHVPPYKGVAVQDQPAPQLYYHRPLHELFAEFFRVGMVLDALEEPNFDEKYLMDRDVPYESIRRWTQIPKLLAFRMRFP